MLTVACVCVGDKYSMDYVLKLKNMVFRHLKIPHEFICLTDKTDEHEVPLGDYIDIIAWTKDLPGWWSKMHIFNRVNMPEGRIIYLDLDTVIIGDLAPLAEWSGEFGICANFTRAAGNPKYPCKYGSCVMSLAPGFGQTIWETFNHSKNGIRKFFKYGDQEVIERIHPNADYLQEAMPPGFFLGYRDIKKTITKNTAVVVFGGNHKPDNCKVDWVKEAWQ